MATGKEVMDILLVNQPTSRNFAQQFQCAHQIVTHQHQVEVLHQPQEASLEIRNHFTVQTAVGLEKITEILLDSCIIRITDTFDAATDPSFIFRKEYFSNQSTGTPRIRKYMILKPQEEVQETHKSKDTKNVVKNIIRLFQGWLEESLPKSRQTYDQLCTFVSTIKFNNHLIMRMVKQRPIRQAFLVFGHGDAIEFIEKSKIHDKRTHLEALRKYLELFEHESRGGMEEICMEGLSMEAEASVLIKQK